MPAERAAPQGGKDIQHGALGNAADASRRQFEPGSVALYVTLQAFGQFLEYAHLTPRFISHYPFNQIVVDGIRIAAPENAVQHPIKSFHFYEPPVLHHIL